MTDFLINVAAQVPVVALFAWVMLKLVDRFSHTIDNQRKEYIDALAGNTAELKTIGRRMEEIGQLLATHDQQARTFIQRQERKRR